MPEPSPLAESCKPAEIARLFESAGLARAALPATETFARAVLGKALVCLAVWLTFAARDATGRILAILWPISAFVLLGLEHSEANIYFFPQTWIAGGTFGITAAAANLFWGTRGNVAGSAGGVALVYRFAYLGPAAR